MKWVKFLAGKSYYHQPQRMGKSFLPNELAGYFNDLTAKTCWKGRSDNDGVPVNTLATGHRVYFVTTVVQKALGHWDQWLLNHEDIHKEEFLKLCRWLLIRQDDQGGWQVWSDLGLSLSSPYSAMTQGECISALVRAWKLTGDYVFATGARRAVDLMRRPIEKKGPAIFEGDYLFLEEMPTVPRCTILNGWIFALFGLYDYWLAFKDTTTFEIFNVSLGTLKQHLEKYDAGYWSYYDVLGHLSSSFYHDLHIYQLTALTLIDSDPVFTKFRNRWLDYEKSSKNRTRAFVVKAIQKLKEPGEVAIT